MISMVADITTLLNCDVNPSRVIDSLASGQESGRRSTLLNQRRRLSTEPTSSDLVVKLADKPEQGEMSLQGQPMQRSHEPKLLDHFFWLVAAWVKSRAERPSVSGVNRQLHVQIGCKLGIRNRKDELTKQAKRNKLQIKPEGN